VRPLAPPLCRRRSRRQRDVYSEFVNLEDVSAQTSKMLLGVWFCARLVHSGEYAWVESVSIVGVMCNSKKMFNYVHVYS
jgi:hypothetical protein